MRKSRAALVVVFFGAVCAAGGSVDRVPLRSPDGLVNLARQPGARATASSVYNDGRTPIRQICHLNDGLHGNAHSWIARENPAWAEIDLGAPSSRCVRVPRDGCAWSSAPSTPLGATGSPTSRGFP